MSSSGRLYGRNADYAAIMKLIDEVAEGPLWICIYGFAGIGKTSLLGGLNERLKEMGLKAIGSDAPATPYQTLGYYESLTGFLTRITASTTRARFAGGNRYSVIQEFVEEFCQDHTFLLIDEVRGSDQTLIDDLAWLVSRLIAAQTKTYVITTSRATPSIIAKSTLPIHPIRLDPLSLEVVHDFLAQRWPGDAFAEKSVEVFQATGGNPKLIELVCGNLDTWARFEAGNPLEFDVLEEVYRDIQEQGWEDALASLCVLASVTPEWDDNAAKAVVADWYSVRTELTGRCLVDQYEEGTYRVHDLLARASYERLSGASRVAVHDLAGQHYASMDTATSLVVAITHFARSGNLSQLQHLHRRKRDHLRFHAYLPEVERALNEILQVLSDEESPLLPLRASILEDLGFLHNNLGEFDQALGEFSESARIHRLTGNKSGEAWALLGKGYILRLRGELAEALSLSEYTVSVLSEANDIRGLSWAFRERGELLATLKDYDGALFFYRLSRQQAIVSGDILGEIHVLRSIADIHLGKARAKEAQDLFNQALEKSKEIGYRMGMGLAYQGLAKSQWARFEVDKALNSYTEALREFERIKDPIGLESARRERDEVLATVKR